MSSQLTIVKIGGKVIDDEVSLDAFLKDFAQLMGPKILVHGGGKIASAIGQKLGIEAIYHEGRRITDLETLDLVTMVYGGLVNKKIVAKLQALNQNAIGLTGADGNILPAQKRPVQEIDFGYAGDIYADEVNVASIVKLLDAGFTPVLCALTHDQKGHMLNTNADTIASVVAGALCMKTNYQVSKLVYCFEQPGVLEDFATKKVIDHINLMKYQSLKSQGIINEGMIPKMHNAFDALKGGATQVKIGHFSDIMALVSSDNCGTKITLE